MSKNLTNPLQSFLKDASECLPTRTGYTQKFHNRFNVQGPDLILADVSGSMSSLAWGGRQKIDVLREAITYVRENTPSILITFSSTVQENVYEIPQPGGNTALHLALESALKYSPKTTLVISDGQPDDPSEALRQTHYLTGVINTLYVGPDTDQTAIRFMNDLARSGCGVYQKADLTNQKVRLGAIIQKLLIEHRK